MITQCHLVAMLSHELKELKTAIQCLGIKPKAIYDSYIKDTERKGISSSITKETAHGKPTKTTVINFGLFPDFPSCKNFAINIVKHI